MVYVKHDDRKERTANLDIKHVVYIDKSRTGDFTLTRQIREIVDRSRSSHGGREAATDDLDALLEDKNLPLDDVSRRLLDDTPEQGVLTISNALQWRLQYSRAISTAVAGTAAPKVVDLRA